MPEKPNTAAGYSPDQVMRVKATCLGAFAHFEHQHGEQRRRGADDQEIMRGNILKQTLHAVHNLGISGAQV